MSDKSGSPPCGIYIRITDFSDMAKVITSVRQMAMVINRASGYDKNMNVVELVYDGVEECLDKIKDLTTILQAEGIVVILSGKVEGFDIMGADGILLHICDLLGDARKALGQGAIIGVSCGSDRSKVGRALEQGADYVVLAADSGLVSWCSAQIQDKHFSNENAVLIASGSINTTNHNCTGLVLSGAGFIECTNYIMNYEKGVMQATVNIMHAIEVAASSPKVFN